MSSGRGAFGSSIVGALLAALILAASASAATAPVKPATPDSGRYTFLLKLDPASTTRVFEKVRARGEGGARSAARSQRATVAEAQADVAGSLPADAQVLFRTHSLISGIAVSTDAANYDELRDLPEVKAVYPVAPKEASNASAVPLQGAPAVWTAHGDLGEDTSIAIIDSGIDYTHADFGGPGTESAYEDAHADEASPADPGLFPSDKVVGGYDFVGDDYDAASDDEALTVPQPDPNPLDCGGHGTHVAGTAAGYGENPDGTTFAGTYDDSLDFDAMKIGPGMAPLADLYAYRVLGCDGSTDVVGDAIDRATDPDDDGDPSDHVDVINMSLGSDFGLTDDGDTVLANAAVDLGVSVVVSAGNGGDVTDISGSPGNASQVTTVANSQDAISRIDGAEVSIDGGAPETFGITRAERYDWKAGPDLIGTVIEAPPENETACAPYPANTFGGEVVLVKWTDDNLECGSITRGQNLREAGAGGFIFASNKETFSAGINGDDQIPGVLMVKSGGDAIRDAIENSLTVEVSGTSVNTVDQDFPDDVDKMAPSSSRGIHANGNVKPDVTAVGTSVLSAHVGTGDVGVSYTGTSMSAPMVAGLSALVRSAHPDWSPLQIKADIMNTAGQDLHVNGSADPAGDTYSPVRAGAGRIQAEPALENDVLAYNAANGVVSVSFGPVEVSAETTMSRQVTVENTGAASATYDTTYRAITSVPGISYSASPNQITLAPGDSKTVTVRLHATGPGDLAKTVDPTIGRESGFAGVPRQALAEAAGRLLLEPTSGTRPTLRAPVYSAPRPVSAMGQPGSIETSGTPVQTAAITLSGSGLGWSGANGAGDPDPDDDVFSLALGSELQATSGVAPPCSASVEIGCYEYSEARSADLKHVGFTSDAPTEAVADARGYFAITTQQPWTIPTERQTFQVDIDVDGDDVADAYLFNARAYNGDQAEDVFVSTLIDSDGNQLGNGQLLNRTSGDVDTAIYDSDSIVLPFKLAALEPLGIDAANPRITYGIESYSYSYQPVDLIGVDPESGDLSDPLTVDLFDPGVRVTGSDGSGPLLADRDGEEVTVHRDPASYRADDGKGLLMLHFHNKVGDKAQVVEFTEPKPEPEPEPEAKGPAITFRTTSPVSRTRFGWYRRPVTITFTCTAGDAPLTGACPGPAVLSRNGRSQSVSRTVSAADGTTATATAAGINIDRTRPRVKIKRVRRGKAYRKAPKGKCFARDALSGRATCRLKRRRRGKRLIYTAIAKDKAGNLRKTRVKARIRRR